MRNLTNMTDNHYNRTMRLYHDYMNKSDLRHVFVVELVALAGIIIMLFGYRFIRFAMFVCGFWISFCVFYTFSPILIRKHYSCDKNRGAAVQIVSSFMVGTLVGLFTASMYRFGILLIGKCLGFLLAMALLHSNLFEDISSYYVISIFVTVVAFASSALAWKFEKPLMIISTSLVGSFTFLCGIDIYIQSNFSLMVISMLVYLREAFMITIKRHIFTTNKTQMGEIPTFHNFFMTASSHLKNVILCSWIALFILSVIFQFKISSKDATHGGKILPVKCFCKCLCPCCFKDDKENLK